MCVRCVMDTTDVDITFDENGVCSYCQSFESRRAQEWFPNDEGRRQLEQIAQRIREYGSGKEYDCIIGLSGGVDSSYMTYLAKAELGLRPLVFHVDTGWNSELATKNIENIVKKLGLDLFTYVVDWEEMRDLQLAFLKSGVANQDIPQDHAIFAMLYRYATQYNIKYVFNGSNFATESVLPTSWGYDAMDARHLIGIHRKFGKIKLKTFPTISFFQYYFYFPFIKQMEIVRPLNYIPYSKVEAMRVLERDLGWRYYGCKHGESRFTKFFQTYYLPVRFGFDKRKAHLSSLILAGQMSRDSAIVELQSLPYDPNEIEAEKGYICKKLGITVDEFEELMRLPLRTYRDYPSNIRLLTMMRKARRFLKR